VVRSNRYWNQRGSNDNNVFEADRLFEAASLMTDIRFEASDDKIVVTVLEHDGWLGRQFFSSHMRTPDVLLCPQFLCVIA
jgi:hypothetical protein